MTETSRTNIRLEIARQVLRTESDAIRALIDRLDHNFVSAVELLATCKGRVILTGMGKSGIISRIIAISQSGATPEILRLLETL